MRKEEIDALVIAGAEALRRRDLPGAARAFDEAARARPDDAAIHANLGGVLLVMGRVRDALASGERALALRPDLPEALVTTGTALLAIERVQEGIARLERALALRPEVPEVLNNLARGYVRLDLFERAEAVLRRAIELRPNYVEALVNLGSVLRARDRAADALAAFERAVALEPNHPVARWFLTIARIPVVYHDEAEVAATRARYEKDLRELEALHARSSPATLARCAWGVGITQPFLLAYQGENDRELQAIYGGLAHRISSAAYPALVTPVAKRARAAGDRVRVGIVSGYFSRHSNWKIPIRGWIEQLDRGAFALFGYHTRDARDDATDAARASLERLELGPKSIEEWGSIIRGDALDVVIFPELGMDSGAMRLACLRLAPVQCSSWGHPNTSGLPTIDYFLSSDRMEPADGDAYYTESLVRLPNLGIYYDGTSPQRVEVTRAELGVRDDAVAYFCCQSLFKYLPRHDDVFARIARELPAAQFLFVEGSPDVDAIFRARLERVFASHGLRASDHCVFTPPLLGGRFDGAIRVMDAYLDSVGWSGCNSTLESLAWDLPVVTTPGKTMRARHSAAILAQMEMEDCVSPDVDAYVARAVALGRDPELRGAMRARIAANKAKAYRDRAAIDGLEAFLRRVAG